MTSQQAKNFAFKRLPAFGMNQNEFNSLDQLWTKESNWNYQAKNKNSGALGIPQLMGANKVPNYQNDYETQIDHGLSYIQKRYGTPSAAWNFHQKNGWY